MYRTTRLKITDLNPHLKCVLCGGYYVDATTIVECLHSFCRTCILRYLETSKFCPICDVMIHKTRPVTNIRADKTLQDLVYKLVPGLYKNEMKRRREFYASHPTESKRACLSGESLGYEAKDRVIYTEDERISLCLELSTGGVERAFDHSDTDQKADVRYLQCPAAVTVSHIKKFIRMKYDLSPLYKIDVFHTDEALKDDLTLMDIAYIYTWRRRAPLKLYYSVYENGVKRVRLECTEKELSDGTQPTEPNRETGPSVVEGSADQPDSSDTAAEIRKAELSEDKQDSDSVVSPPSQKPSEHKEVNENEKRGCAQEAKENETVNGEAIENGTERRKNNKSPSEALPVKQEQTAEKDPTFKEKDRNTPEAYAATCPTKEEGAETPQQPTGNTDSSTVNSLSTDKEKSDDSKDIGRVGSSFVNGCHSLSPAPQNGKAVCLVNGSNEKSDKIATERALNGSVFIKPASNKDRPKNSPSQPGRKMKQPKRSLDDTVAKCKARELALQAAVAPPRISNGGAG